MEIKTFNELKYVLNKTESKRNSNNKINLSSCIFKDMNLSGANLKYIDFSDSEFINVNLKKADFSDSSIENAMFKECPMMNCKFVNTNMKGAELRYIDLSGSDISGANLHCAILEFANLENVKANKDTKWFRLHCPEEGAFIGWKCCTELRVVQLLIPEDAQRVSSTMRTCRTDKAKVLSIKSIDETVSYDWAQSTVDPNFYYEKGKWIEPANGFNPNRWQDSTRGIHFFMERQEAVDYQAK